MLFAEAFILLFGWFILRVGLWVFYWVGIGAGGFAGLYIDAPRAFRGWCWNDINIRLAGFSPGAGLM